MAPDQGGGGHFHTDRIGLLGAAWGRNTKTVAAWLRCPHCTIIQSYACTRRASFHLICSHLQAQESAVLGGQPFHSIHMESAVLGGQLDLWQQLEEDLGQPMRWGDDAWAVLAVSQASSAWLHGVACCNHRRECLQSSRWILHHLVDVRKKVVSPEVVDVTKAAGIRAAKQE